MQRKTRQSINITSVFVLPLALDSPACGPRSSPPNPHNPIYQTTEVGTDALFAWSFLL
jgi:hypothetical protein